MQTNPTERLNFSNIGRALLKKCSKYGSLNKPYIIAINIINSYFRVDSKHDNMLDLLLGKTEYIYDPNTKTETPTRKMDGTWRSKNGPRYKRNSGILALERLYVHNFNKCKKIYYPNPWAKNVYHGKLENIDHYKVDDGKYIFESGDKFPNL